jgi:hypothetical protein
MAFNIDEGEPDETITPKTKDARTNYKLEYLLNAPDITNDEYDELSVRKKQGKTTTEENFKVEKRFWQRYLVQEELESDLLKHFMFDNNPLDHFIALVDINNHQKEDNLRSAKMIEKVDTVKNLLHGLGFMNEMDRGRIKRDDGGIIS